MYSRGNRGVNEPLQPDLASASRRVLSIDVFRGLTMLVMIFANDLDMAHIQDVPNWMKHAVYATPKIPADKVNHITFVDVLAPAFLFIVGSAIPLAFRKRLLRGDSGLKIAGHVLLRSVSLMVMGAFIGNMRSQNVCPSGLSHAAWSLLMLAGLALVWNDYPKTADWRRYLFLAMRLAGIAALAWLAMIYHRKQGDGLVRMYPYAWHVLGVIGWSYLVACIVYVLFRRQMAGVVGSLGLLVLLWIADHAGVLDRITFLAKSREVVSLGHLIASHASITVAGVVIGMLFVDGPPARTPGQRIRWIAVFGGMVFVAGLMLRPIYGLSKPRTTPAWSLYSIAICCGLFALTYWIIDVKGYQRWTGFTLPAGRNPLVAYFLHYLIHPLSVVLGIEWLNGHLNVGWVGIARTLGVTFLMGVVLTHALTRLHVRLRR